MITVASATLGFVAVGIHMTSRSVWLAYLLFALGGIGFSLVMTHRMFVAS